MTNRSILENGTSIELYVEEKGRRDSREFHITKLVSDKGASAIAYRAYHQNSSNIGVLREYYPQKDDIVLERDADGRIHVDMNESSEAERKEYLDGRERYLAPYVELGKLQREKENDDLASFIPYFEICYGCKDMAQDDGTVYVWTPAPQTKTFSDFCELVHNGPEAESEYKLYTILSAMLSLAKCIGEMHAIHPVGLIHRDIKPDNFGFTNRGGELLTQSISLFDIDSICKAYPVPEEDIGTPGFMENDYERRNDNLRDIYSIGATLFYAMIITDETESLGFKYNDSLYERLPELVKNSKLISSSESNSYPKLRSYLVRILKKCLCSRYSQDGRYEDCKSLAVDIQTAISYIVPFEVSRKYISGEKWVLQDAKKWFDENERNTSSLCLRYHLYKYPLYMTTRGKETLQVLFVGFGKYGFRFLDMVLEMSQNLGVDISVVIISDSSVKNDTADKDLYLEERPELKNFFNVSGYEKVKSPYGSIEFKSAALIDSSDEFIIHTEFADSSADYSRNFDYMFIDLGDNSLNAVMGEKLHSTCQRALVSYVHEGLKTGLSTSEHLIPVNVSANVRSLPDFAEIERMAFNAHLVWNENRDISFEVKKSEFQDKYYFDSCVSNVLSIKYKLWREGIDLDKNGIYEAADSMSRKLNETPKEIQTLAWLEHRRWVTEKICDGWATRSIEQCYEVANTEDDVTRNQDNKVHVCIVNGEANWKLDGVATAKWDVGGIDVSKLDPLDRLSVELHRFYENQAEHINLGDFESERQQLTGTSAFSAFEEWIEKKNEIQKQGDRDTAASFNAYWIKLKKAVEDDDSGNITEAQKKQIVKTIGLRIAPVLQRYEYKDYKKIDVDLIKSIPYILTYCEHIHLVYPMETFTNVKKINDINISSEFVFEHVVAATILDVAKVTYLYYAPEASGFNIFDAPVKLSGLLKRLMAYKKRKGLRFSINLVIFCHTEGTKSIYEMSDLNGEDISIEFINVAKREEPFQAASRYIEEISKESDIVLAQETNVVLNGWLSNSNFRKMLSCFKLDKTKWEFSSAEECEWIGYITRKVTIGARDIAELSGRKYIIEDFLDFGNAENTDLWKIYKKDSSRWKRCSKFLSKNEHSFKELLVCKKKDVCGDNNGTFRLYMPSQCYASILKCKDAFLQNGMIGQESSVILCSDTVCCLIAKCTPHMRDLIDHMFLNPYAFEDPDRVGITNLLDAKKKAEGIRIEFDSLEFGNVDLRAYVNTLAEENQIRNTDQGRISAENEIKSLLTIFHGKGIIHNLSSKANAVHFTYGSYTIKKLMRDAGNVLEFEVYHQLSEMNTDKVGVSSCFDDVASITFLDENQSPTEQIDCLVTKGSHSLIIECKAQDNLSDDKIDEYIEKLEDRVDKFGISCKGLLLIDSKEPLTYKKKSRNVIIKRLDDIEDNTKPNGIGRYAIEMLTK